MLLPLSLRVIFISFISTIWCWTLNELTTSTIMDHLWIVKVLVYSSEWQVKWMLPFLYLKSLLMVWAPCPCINVDVKLLVLAIAKSLVIFDCGGRKDEPQTIPDDIWFESLTSCAKIFRFSSVSRHCNCVTAWIGTHSNGWYPSPRTHEETPHLNCFFDWAPIQGIEVSPSKSAPRFLTW